MADDKKKEEKPDLDEIARTYRALPEKFNADQLDGIASKHWMDFQKQHLYDASTKKFRTKIKGEEGYKIKEAMKDYIKKALAEHIATWTLENPELYKDINKMKDKGGNLVLEKLIEPYFGLNDDAIMEDIEKAIQQTGGKVNSAIFSSLINEYSNRHGGIQQQRYIKDKLGDIV